VFCLLRLWIAKILGDAQMLILCLALSLSFATSVSVAKKEQALSPAIPAEYAERIHLDQAYNIASRSPFGKVWIKEAERGVKPVYHFDIPVQQAEIFASAYLDSATQSQMIIEKDGQRFVRVFVLGSNQGLLRKLWRKYGQPQQEYWAAKMLGKSTYFMFNPKRPNDYPYQLKTEIPWDDKGTRKNTREAAALAVMTNDYIEESVRNSKPKEGRLWEFMPERFAVHLPVSTSGHTETYTNILRSMGPMTGEPLPAGSKIAPIHGLLDNTELLKEISAAANMTPDDWIEKEYLPKVSKYFAQVHIELGIYPEGHTQNLSLQYDVSTGRIQKIITKDFSDVMLDMLGRIVSGQRVPASPDPNGQDISPMRLNEFWSTDDSAKLKYAGENVSSFSDETIGGYLFNNEKRANKLKGIYLDTYKNEAERLLGRKLNLSQAALRDIQGIKETLPAYRIVSGGWFVLANPAKDALTRAANELQQLVTRSQFFQWLERQDLSMQFDKSVQSVLSNQYGDVMRTKAFSPAFADAEWSYNQEVIYRKKSPQFFYQDGRIFVYAEDKSEVYGVTHVLSTEKQNLIKNKIMEKAASAAAVTAEMHIANSAKACAKYELLAN
jgi:hypothetical protein